MLHTSPKKTITAIPSDLIHYHIHDIIIILYVNLQCISMYKQEFP